jgi:hypothetical protein
VWGEEQKAAFDKTKEHLMPQPVLQAPKMSVEFKLYVAAQELVIGVVLLQEDKGREFPIAYVSRWLIDAETRYAFIEKLCLSLYYACMKFRHYILSNTCIVACQHDIVKHLLHKPVLSGWLGKWAYTLVEFDLVYLPLWAMKGQVIADFIVEHTVVEEEVCVVEVTPWDLFFDGSVCTWGQGIGCVIVSPGGVCMQLSIHLEFPCTNNQVESMMQSYAVWNGLRRRDKRH